MRDEKAVITHHEAGHAVAALMTVAGDLEGPVSACIVAGRGTGNTKINDWVIDEPVQAAFVFYAGPWAEARVQWRQPALEGLDDTDASGRSFRMAVRAAFLEGVGRTGDLAYYNGMAKIDSSIPERETDWSRALERAWPVIGALAKALRDGLDAAEPGPHPYAELPDNDGLTATRYEIAGDDVVALVQPQLEARGIWRSVT
ncbi:hypothetical protein H7J87_27825 [Mycolicibacterium wolinskyi]|uniref:Peptidase M41 domain-containing protein n=1 Tax=Mycolicibacterium wolinskyi TaxID=59750 RepID=A0A1X2FCC8_9MYCO|nr:MULTISPECIES: hypothetical protein [Mycolicibacterium]MCV7289142.1 hypothetical protein [Mycolicibacterium wolinskyi]MCV7297303.1 hypothetical protein [Mycolicibacterium goodii]ORX15978.1 hypothetical protein AWC31_00985 [Mycolicibacterium wolinskyi]